jgi:opacity protein-like surface antigen
MKLATAVLALAFAGVLAAADVAGKWVAQVPGRDGQTRETTFNFKVDGAKLSGTMATQMGEVQISDGKVEGDNLSFAVQLSFGGNDIKLLFKGTVAGNEIKFTREREGGQGRAQEFTAKRAAT